MKVTIYNRKYDDSIAFEIERRTDRLFEECKACKAYVQNAEPVESAE